MEGVLKNWLKQVRMNESTISTLLGVMVVVVVGVLLFNYFKSARLDPQIEPEAIVTEQGVELEQRDGKLIPKNLPAAYTVAAGDHLWAIAEKHYGSGYNWVDVAEVNGLTSPDTLLVGQELTLPQVEVRVPEGVEIVPMVAGDRSIESQIYAVESGDDLWNIAVRAYGDGYRWSEVWEANKELIVDPNMIEAGMQLMLPR